MLHDIAIRLKLPFSARINREDQTTRLATDDLRRRVELALGELFVTQKRRRYFGTSTSCPSRSNGKLTERAFAPNIDAVE